MVEYLKGLQQIFSNVGIRTIISSKTDTHLLFYTIKPIKAKLTGTEIKLQFRKYICNIFLSQAQTFLDFKA